MRLPDYNIAHLLSMIKVPTELCFFLNFLLMYTFILLECFCGTTHLAVLLILFMSLARFVK